MDCGGARETNSGNGATHMEILRALANPRKLIEHHGPAGWTAILDLPEIRNWTWSNPA
jgi:hypothetical protein